MNVHPTAIVHDNVRLGEGVTVEPYCILGSDDDEGRVDIGPGSLIRAYTRIHGNVEISGWLQTGNHVLIKGDDVRIMHGARIGSYSSIEGPTAFVGKAARIYGRVEMSLGWVGDRARIYCGAVLSDMRRPPEGPRETPRVEEDAMVFIGALVMAGVTVGVGAQVAAHAVAVKDVPAGHLLKRDGSMVEIEC